MPLQNRVTPFSTIEAVAHRGLFKGIKRQISLSFCLTMPIVVDTNKWRSGRRMRMDKPATNIETIANTCIAGRLRLINRVVSNIYDAALRPFGLKISQGNILIFTGKLGVASPVQICEYLQLDASTLSRNVELMRKNGWLEEVPTEDARSRPFRLTEEGKRLIESAIPAWEKAQAEAKELLGDDFVSLLNKAVKRASESNRA